MHTSITEKNCTGNVSTTATAPRTSPPQVRLHRLEKHPGWCVDLESRGVCPGRTAGSVQRGTAANATEETAVR